MTTLITAPISEAPVPSAEKLKSISAEEKRRLLAELLAKKKAQPREYPVSFGQERLWFVEQLVEASERSAYNIIIALGLQGSLHIAALKKSLNELIRRHAVLRTTFRRTETGYPVTVIAPQLTIELPVIDMQTDGQAVKKIDEQAAVEEAVQAFCTAQVDQPFDLVVGPLVRTHLLQTGPDRYVLVWVVHHTIFDGFSASIWTRELAALYGAFIQDAPSPLAELPQQYYDFARWQREQFSGELMQRQLDYWTKQLAGAPPLLPLPTDFPRPPVQTGNGNIHRRALGPELTQALKDLSHQAGVTLFTTLYSAFAILLARYSGQNDVLIGSAVTNRGHSNFESMIGFLVNLIVLRQDISDNPTCLTLLQRVQATTRAALIHQDLPFEKLVDALKPERNASYEPIAQVTISWTQKFIAPAHNFGGLVATPLPVTSTTAQRDLSLLLLELDDSIISTWEYNTDLFKPETVARMAEHLVRLMESIIRHPEQPVLELPMLTASEYQQVVHAWNAPQGTPTVAQDELQAVHKRFEQQVERTPQAIAVQSPESKIQNQSHIAKTPNRLTYAELNTRANQLAHYLIERGVGADTPVAVAMTRSVDLVVSFLAILKAGGAYVPVDPSYPPERIEYILADSRASIVLTRTPHLAENAVAYGHRYLLAVDTAWEQLAQQPTHNPQRQVSLDDLIYIIYTSGSTGQPKGVAVHQRGFANLLNWFVQEFQLCEEDSVLLVSSPGFDLTQKNIYAPLLVGGSLHLIEEYDPAQIVDRIEGHGITWINCTPSAFYPLIESRDWPVSRLRSLRYLFLGGEPIAVARLQRWMQDASFQAQIVNTYGPTECTDIGAAYTLPPQWARGTGAETVPIGRPTYNVQLYILDAKLQPVPIGVAGELYIGGIQVSRGYLNRPDLTAERFIVHSEFGRIYKTGDLCRWLVDGNIEYMGRTDFQVKIRGFRVELGEIENALLAQDGVREAVVIAREDGILAGAGARLVAYLVADGITGDIGINAESLRLALATRLPEYMVPSAFVTLDAMPLSANGKINRHALPAPDYTESGTDYVAPRDDLERGLTHTFAEVLRLPQIGIHDNFFHMGGDSILILQLVSRAAQQGHTLRVKELFQHPTVAQLATAIRTAQAAGQPQVVAAQEVQLGAAPLLPIQQRFLEAGHPVMHHSNQPFLLVVKTPLDPARLAAAVAELLRHHDALRFRYYQDERGWHQEYLPPQEQAPLELVELGDVPVAARAAAIERIGTQVQGSLDPFAGDLVRVVYFRTGQADGSERLLFVVHHLAMDGVSRRLLMEDLTTLLDGGQLSPKTSSYRDWAETLQRATVQGYFEAARQMWMAHAADADIAVALPLDDPAAPNTMAGSHQLSFTLAPTQTEQLVRTLPALHGVTLDALLLTALAETLAEWSGQQGVRIQMESYGRQELFDTINLNRTVGRFTSIYPVTAPRTVGAAVARIRATQAQLSRVMDGGLSFGALRYYHPDSAVRDQFAKLLTAPVMYNNFGQLANIENGRFAGANESPGLRVAPTNKPGALINCDVLLRDGQLLVSWLVSAQLHRATAERMVQAFVQQLDQLIADAINYSQSGLQFDGEKR